MVGMRGRIVKYLLSQIERGRLSLAPFFPNLDVEALDLLVQR
jgi:hypothetical protein